MIISDWPTPQLYYNVSRLRKIRAAKVAYLIILTQNLVTNGQRAILYVSRVEDITSIDLNILDIKFGDPVDKNPPSIIFLATLFGIEIGFIQDQPKLAVRRDTLGTLDKLFLVINGLDFPRDISAFCHCQALFL
jgi:hypothetical protein